MNTTELSAEFQSGIVLIHYFSGPLFFAFNAFVCILILIDSDSRGKGYRKYLFALQFWSTIADINLNIYAPFFQFNCRVIYADSAYSKIFNLEPFYWSYMVVFVEIEATYFSCIYYRRNMILRRDSPFCFHGWRYVAFIAAVHLYMHIVSLAFTITLGMQSSAELVPNGLTWVKEKSTFLLIIDDYINYAAAIITFIFILLFSCVLMLMIGQLLYEIKKGMLKSSAATKRYQIRADSSILLQGSVPSILYAIPIIGGMVLHLATRYFGEEAIANNRTGKTIFSAVSVFGENVMSLHGFAHSLTIFACSPSYRKTVYVLVALIASKIRLALFGRSERVEPEVDAGESRSTAFTVVQ